MKLSLAALTTPPPPRPPPPKHPLFTTKIFSTKSFGPGHIIGAGILAFGVAAIGKLIVRWHHEFEQSRRQQSSPPLAPTPRVAENARGHYGTRTMHRRSLS